jgi:DNA-binding beta-propeller fold protein YncE
MASEEFRRGVQSYYRGAFNEAVMLFERTLSLIPGENLVLDWLGKAYYRSGIEGAAMQQWQFASDSGYGGLLLKNQIEIVRERRVTGMDAEETLRYVEAGSFPGQSGTMIYYRQPVSVLPLEDGSCWVAAYGSNELVRFDVNGTITARTEGRPLTGFDRPMDILRLPEGDFLVSEYAGNRISRLNASGFWISSFGKRGRGSGEFIGPQYLAADSSGTIYVTDFGNRRIVVFDKNGEALFTFGQKNGAFPGFSAPTGIAVVDGIVYAADSVFGGIYCFDTAGNYIDMLVPAGTFGRPEAMRSWEGYLLVADSNRVVAVDTATGAWFETAKTGNAPSRITCAAPDVNGNILVTDFVSGEVYVLSRMSDLVGGLFVQIDRIISDRFPDITLEIRVENRRRQPLVGLKDKNFFVTEEKRPVARQLLAGAASNNDICDVTIVIERSAAAAPYGTAIRDSVREIAAAMNGRGILRIVSAGDIPSPEGNGNPAQFSAFTASSLRSPAGERWAFDMGIRLAANELINAEKKRAVIFLSAGPLSENAFSRYGLTNLAAYLNNNGIIFSTIYLSQGAPQPELSYLCSQTNGKSYYVYRPEGLSPVVSDILAVPNGSYRITYTSSLPTDFGRAFLPVEMEVYLLNRSGRTEAGYFAPLE